MILVPPTALTLSGYAYWLDPKLSEYHQALAHRYWHEWYVRDGDRPCVQDGHIVVEYQRIVEIAILVGITRIECRTYYFDP